jgi:ribosomal protein S18 acetylase RimI-like enzyme
MSPSQSNVLRIRTARLDDAQALSRADFSFVIAKEARGPFVDSLGEITPVAPYTKTYGFDEVEFARHVRKTDLFAIVADLGERGEPVGYALAAVDWSGFAVVDDIAVDRAYRGLGTASALMDAVRLWASERRLGGVRLETQSNNLAACRFYERYGFALGGYDRHLYGALHPGTREVALFWYLMLTE